MINKLLYALMGGFLGSMAGTVVGGFAGLVLGGTYLGWLSIPAFPALQGYELAAYIGAGAGVLVGAPWGVKIALRAAGVKHGVVQKHSRR